MSAQEPGQVEDWDITEPRGTTRTIDFTTSEGTGMSVDISPDGEWLVFDLLAQVYRLPVRGGEAQCLTQGSGIALNYHPSISPDGTRIAFVSDRGGQNNLWVMEADGTNPRAVFTDPDTQVSDPAWTPDGEAIVAVRLYPHAHGPWTRARRLWLFPLNGDPPRELAGSRDQIVYAPSISPDGRYLYYHASSRPVIAEGYYKIGTQHELRRLDLATGADDLVSDALARRYYHREPFYRFAPTVSPNGEQLAFARRVPGKSTLYKGVAYAQRTGLWVRDLATGAERLVVERMAPDQLETHTMYQIRLLPGYAWSADGGSIVYAEGGQIRRASLAEGRVETIPFTARVRRVISERVRPEFRIAAQDSFAVRFPRWPALSPDGTAAVFEGAGTLWRLDLSGTDPVPMLAPDAGGPVTAELTPSWSPNGSSLAYSTWTDEYGGHVWTVDAADGARERLTGSPGAWLHPAWSPDARSIVVARGTGAGLRGEGTGNQPWNDIVLLPADGGTPRTLIRVTPAGGGFVRPVYGPKQRIYFVSAASEAELRTRPQARVALRSISEDGTDLRTHAAFAVPVDAVPSPDGEWLAFSAVEQVYLAPFPAASEGEAPFIYHAAAEGTGIDRVSTAGGLFPHWNRDGTLTFVSGPTLFLLDAPDGRLRELPIDLRIPRPIPDGRIALTGARIVTLDEGEVIEEGTILVEGNRIVGLGRVDLDEADRVIDLAGKTVIPGLIDIHAHHNSGATDGVIVPPHRQESANYLAYGVTTVFDPAAHSKIVFPAAELTAAGKLLGPRMYSTGDVIVGTPGLLWLHSYAEARDTANRRAAWGALGVKQYYQPRRTQRQWLTEAARAQGGLLITGEGMDLPYDLGMIMDGQTAWEHPLLDIPLHDDVVRFVAQSGTVYNPELITPGQGLYLLEYYLSRSEVAEDPKQQRWVRWNQLMRKRNDTRRALAEYPAVLSVKGVKDIVKAGGRVGVGGHGQEQGLGTHWEMWTFALALEPNEALEAATIQNARYLGMDRDIGSIAVGKLADLVILGADPLEDIHNSLAIEQVMLGGRLYDADTLDRIWPDPELYGPRRWSLQSQVEPAGALPDPERE